MAITHKTPNVLGCVAGGVMTFARSTWRKVLVDLRCGGIYRPADVCAKVDQISLLQFSGHKSVYLPELASLMSAALTVETIREARGSSLMSA